MDYNQKCCALKLLPLDKQLLLNKCVLIQKVVHGKAPQYLKDLMFPFERLHVHGNKQLVPRTRIDIFKMSFTLSGSLAWNSLHHPSYPMEVKTFKRKAFHALRLNHFDTCVFSFARHLETKCIACSCQVLHLYFTQKSTSNIYVFSCVIVLSFTFLVVIILMRYVNYV